MQDILSHIKEMDVDDQNTPLTCIDAHTRQSIVDLNQKLIELQKEIATKLSAFSATENQDALQQKEHLQNLSGEVARALKSIEKVVTMVHSDDLTK